MKKYDVVVDSAGEPCENGMIDIYPTLIPDKYSLPIYTMSGQVHRIKKFLDIQDPSFFSEFNLIYSKAMEDAKSEDEKKKVYEVFLSLTNKLNDGSDEALENAQYLADRIADKYNNVKSKVNDIAK